MKLLLSILMGAMYFISTLALAKTTCSQQFANAKQPIVALYRAADIITPMCFNGFAVGYSHTLRTPIWSATHLTKQRLLKARKLKRVNHFHEEMRLPAASRVTLAEIHTYQFDRGHLAPNYVMGTLKQQYDSFSLANIVLQHHSHNRSLWRSIEKLTRHQVYRYGEAYVVTGIALSSPAKRNKKGVTIPSHLFKVVYIPKLHQAGVYWSKNDDSRHIEVISLNDLYRKTGLDVMPSLPSEVKENKLYLPTDMSAPDIKINHYELMQKTKSFIAQLYTFVEEFVTLIVLLFKT